MQRISYEALVINYITEGMAADDWRVGKDIPYVPKIYILGEKAFNLL